MLVEGLFTAVTWLIDAILNLLDVLPEFPEELVTSVEEFFALIFDNLSILGFLVPLSTIKILIPLVILVINFEDVYAFIMWLLRKIPFLGIK